MPGDALPPPPPYSAQSPATEAPYVYAATDVRPRGEREIALCERASHVDYGYVALAVGLNFAAGYIDGPLLKENGHPGFRMFGPLAVGTAWGFTVGGTYLALPKCSADWVTGPTPDGDVSSTWPMALSLALLAGITAPVIQAVEIGGDSNDWSLTERSFRVIGTGLSAFGGALLPYLLPPKTWNAAKEIRKLRLRVDGQTTMVGYGFTF